MSTLQILNHPLFTLSIVLCVLLEYRYSVRRGLRNYDSWEAFTSFAIIAIDRVLAYFTERDVFGPALWLYRHRWFDLSLGRNPWLTFVAVEFAYYWAHRYNHSTNLGWATHSIHHSPTRYNLTMGYRLGLTRAFSLAWMVFLPLMLLGFHPADVALAGGVIFLYQFFIHTELVPKLGFLERFLNTPSNHRVHHGGESRFHDKNFGGITLVFDRLFDTYMAEPDERPLQYGMPEITARRSLIHEIFGQWSLLLGNLAKTRDPLHAAALLLGSPANLAPLKTGVLSNQPLAST